MVDSQRFADLGRPRGIWAVAAVHADMGRLAAVHDQLYPRFRPGERLVYLGNYLGRGAQVIETVDELLAFRRAVLALPGVLANDIVYLRGGQEEIWQKLLQLQFAPNPAQVLDWMLRQGGESTLVAYGGRAEQGRVAARDGAMALTRWTSTLRAAIRSRPGHENLMNALRRAAYTGTLRQDHGLPMPGHDDDGPDGNGSVAAAPPGPGQGVLLVHAGIDPARPFGAQGDSFWWGSSAFGRISHSYGGFRRVVRGYDPGHGGVAMTEHTLTLDGGCGFGGKLVCARLSNAGDVVERIET